MLRDKNSEGRDIRILALEDSARDFELMKELLIDAGYNVTTARVETEDTFASALRGQGWEIILADFKLPGFDAFGALRIRNEICPDTPFICVSGSIGEETAIELLKSGAVDYVIKDRPDRLPFAIGRALDDAREKEFRKQHDEDLKKAYRQLKASQADTLNILADLKMEIQARQAKEVELLKITAAVEQAGETVVITDPEGTIEYVNPAFIAATGYSLVEAMGRNPRFLKSGEHDDTYYRGLWETISGGTDWHGDLINKRKDGTFFTEEATISPVKDGSGRILNFVAVKRDITERKQMEEILVSALEDKTRLVSELFHRTNNNMQVIQALLRYRLSAHPELPLAQFVDDVIGQIQSMAQAQQELFRAGNLSRIDLAEYLPAVAQLVQDRYADQRGAVAISLHLQPLFILLDSAVPLGLVVTELITNSFRHAFCGPRIDGSAGEITVTCAATDSGEIEVRVADSGIGWSPTSAVTASGRGGIGLATALIEQQLNGTITFDENTGTTCVVRFRDNRYKERV